ncbi:unnamed protein product [Protopolystoma xenopodis]|uniref:Uncharacterized protein n=1 Tax=Protopolystoma xenopodis TaxID=117903 RepID=A0A3S5BL21_9PLAT|nr:unnamed protein product [Protopolystoma xenopodis]
MPANWTAGSACRRKAPAPAPPPSDLLTTNVSSQPEISISTSSGTLQSITSLMTGSGPLAEAKAVGAKIPSFVEPTSR